MKYIRTNRRGLTLPVVPFPILTSYCVFAFSLEIVDATQITVLDTGYLADYQAADIMRCVEVEREQIREFIHLRQAGALVTDFEKVSEATCF